MPTLIDQPTTRRENGRSRPPQAEADRAAQTDGSSPADRQVRAHKRRINRGAPPEHLRPIEIVVDMEDKTCPRCGGEFHRIGEERSERLDIVPAQFQVLVIRRPKYVSRTYKDGVVHPLLRRRRTSLHPAAEKPTARRCSRTLAPGKTWSYYSEKQARRSHPLRPVALKRPDALYRRWPHRTGTPSNAPSARSRATAKMHCSRVLIGAEHWATIASLIVTCELNNVDPFGYRRVSAAHHLFGEDRGSVPLAPRPRIHFPLDFPSLASNSLASMLSASDDFSSHCRASTTSLRPPMPSVKHRAKFNIAALSPKAALLS